MMIYNPRNIENSMYKDNPHDRCSLLRKLIKAFLEFYSNWNLLEVILRYLLSIPVGW